MAVVKNLIIHLGQKPIKARRSGLSESQLKSAGFLFLKTRKEEI